MTKSIETRVVDAALDLAAKRGWHDVSMADIARHANVSIAEMRDTFPSRAAILSAFFRQVDTEVLNGADPEADEEKPKDRLFDVLMRRFDAMAPHKPALKRITRDLSSDPVEAAAVAPNALQSLAWMLEAAEIDIGGIEAALILPSLAAMWRRVFRVWLDDDEPDMAQTMMALDAELERAERSVERLNLAADRARSVIVALRGRATNEAAE